MIYNGKELTLEELNNIVEILNNGGVIIFPTDTVYGIGCNAFNIEAIKKIYSFKERPDNKPINVLTNDIKKIESIAYIHDKERTLIEKYMPGALTIILDKKDIVPDILTANLPTVGVRIPKNEIALKILEKVDYPLATTSVNISGKSPGIKLEDFREEFENKVDLIVDGGPSEIKEASTIIRVENDDIKVLREGSIKI